MRSVFSTVRNIFFPILIACVFGLLVPPGVLADTMSSASYKVQADVISIGGGNSTSASFAAESTVGDLATGENLASASFEACAGYQCFLQPPYISFSVKQGTASPGTAGAGVTLGTLTTGAVTTSDGSTVNSVFVTAESNANDGLVVTVRDTNNGLKRDSTSDTIASATATLVAGTAGYGLCVFSVTQHADSPNTLTKASPYNGTCTKTSGHDVGGVSTSSQNILTSAGAIKGGDSEILVKAAISAITAAGIDYGDTLTFVATGTY